MLLSVKNRGFSRMRKKTLIIIVLFITTLLMTSFYFVERVEALIKLRLREMAKQELLKPIKHKIKKILSRSKVRQYKRRAKRIELKNRFE